MYSGRGGNPITFLAYSLMLFRGIEKLNLIPIFNLLCC